MAPTLLCTERTLGSYAFYIRVATFSPPIPSNRVSAWVSGGSNYVYETNKSEREAETEATQDTPFSTVKESFTSCVSSRCAGVSARKPKTSLRPLPKMPNVDCRVLPLAGQRGQVLRHRGAVRGRRPHCRCCATEARGLDLVAWHATIQCLVTGRSNVPYKLELK